MCPRRKTQINSIRRSYSIIFSIIPCILLSTGCSQGQLPAVLVQNKQLREIVLDWQVQNSAEPGAYQLAGKTDLPDKTRLTVAAFRYLYPAAAQARKLHSNPTYAILDYQSVDVEQGKWQTQLNLWQVAADGTFQENWQLDQKRLATRFNPGQEVVFLVTLTPIEQLSTLQQQLAAKGQALDDGTIRTTADGEAYAQAHRTLNVDLPTGSTTTSRPQLEAENFGWGRRYLFPQEPQNPTQLERPSEPITDAPARPEDFLR